MIRATVVVLSIQLMLLGVGAAGPNSASAHPHVLVSIAGAPSAPSPCILTGFGSSYGWTTAADHLADNDVTFDAVVTQGFHDTIDNDRQSDDNSTDEAEPNNDRITDTTTVLPWTPDRRVSLLLTQIDDLRDMLEADFTQVPHLDRIEQMIMTELALPQTDPAADHDAAIQEWIWIAVSFSYRPEQYYRELSLNMVLYCIRVFIRDRSVNVTDPGSLFHQLLETSYRCNLRDELRIVSTMMTSDSLTVWNRLKETPLVAAFRVVPDHVVLLSELVKRISLEDVASTMKAIRPHIEPERWVRLFDNFLHSRFKDLDYDTDAFLDELEVREVSLRRRTDHAIRIHDLFLRRWFLFTYMVMFVPGVTVTDHGRPVPPDQHWTFLCDLYELEGPRRRWFLETLSMLKSGTITAAEVIGQGRFPLVYPELHGTLTDYIQFRIDADNEYVTNDMDLLWSQNPVIPSILQLIIRHADIQIRDLIDPDTAHYTIPFILQRLIPEMDVTDAGVYDQVVELALHSGPGRLRTNLLRIVVFLAQTHYRDPELIAAWTSTMTRADVLGVREIFTFLLDTIANILAEDDGVQFTDSAIRTVTTVISHPDYRTDMTTYGQIPATETQLYTKDFLQSLPPVVLVRIFLSVDDDPMLNEMFRIKWEPDAIVYCYSYLARNYPVWIRNAVLSSLSEQEIGGLADVCSICLCAHYTEKSVPAGADPEQYTHRTQCGHYFHPRCLTDCLQTNINCPICRTALYDLADAVSFARRHPLR